VSGRRLVWIVNPSSRPGRVARCIPIVEKLLRDSGYDVETRVSEKAGDPAVIAAEAAGRVDAILVAGGDGTVCEVINALPDRETPVGYIPLGTANVFARELGLPFDPEAAARVFTGGTARDFDMGKLGDSGFLLMASYGFDAWAVRRTSLRLKRRLGRFAYLLSSLTGMPFYRPEPIEIVADGIDEPVVATFALFANASRYAGAYIAAPGADMHDGLLDVVCWTRPGRAGAILGVVNLFRGRLSEHSETKTFRAPSLRFATKRPDSFQIDGDPADGKAGRIGIVPRAFRLVR
jgi:diacylglycerol kinase (ATP)